MHPTITPHEMARRKLVAELNDVIECDVSTPYPHKLRVRLATPEAVAYGNDLLAEGHWWLMDAAEAKQLTNWH
jgi:hypothetical protein